MYEAPELTRRGIYEAPALTRLGTLREVTKAGINGVLDNAATQNDGCGALGTRCS